MKPIVIFGIVALVLLSIMNVEAKPVKDENDNELQIKTDQVIGKLRRAQNVLKRVEEKLVEEQAQNFEFHRQIQTRGFVEGIGSILSALLNVVG